MRVAKEEVQSFKDGKNNLESSLIQPKDVPSQEPICIESLTLKKRKSFKERDVCDVNEIQAEALKVMGIDRCLCLHSICWIDMESGTASMYWRTSVLVPQFKKGTQGSELITMESLS